MTSLEPDNSLRDALIRRIQQLPDNALPRVADLVAQVEREVAPNFHSPARQGNHSELSRDWPHAPVHRVSEFGTYIVTAGTLHKQHLFRGAERLDLLERQLLSRAREFNWHLEAWAVFSNHYHFVAHSQSGSTKLDVFLKHLHAQTAQELNRFDGESGRSVWYNFRDTLLTYEQSYFARLNYVHHNPVRHGLVCVANQYRWCSAAWFERTATPAQVKTIYGFKTDKVKVIDDYEPVL